MMSREVQFYTRADLASLEWPHTPDGDYAHKYLVPFIKDGPQKYISNVHNTEMLISKIGDTLLPLTITDFHPDNAYTCSPYSHYISYGGFEEVHRLNNLLLETLIKLLVLPIAGYFRHNDLDRVVYVNNWLLSTNLYPAISADELEVLARELPRRFVDRAIVFRSIDNLGNPHLYDMLKKVGYEMVLSRQVWYQNPQDAQHKKQFKVDRSLLRRSDYEIIDGRQLADSEIPRALELYNMLYLTKYSHYNPQFTKEFMGLALDLGLLFLKGLRRAGKLNGIMGYFIRNGLMTQPMFGYDTQLPQKEGLYRILSLLTIQEGLSNGLIVHASGGVGKFKKLRGGRSVIEYNAVYDRHLPSRRQLPWRMLKRVSDLAIPFFKKNDF
jgi:hypothetical protein